MAAGILLIFGTLSWYLFSGPGLPSAQSPPQSQSNSTTEDNHPNIERINPEDAKTAYDQNRAVFVDVRDVDEYEEGHIPGAIHIPLLDIPSRVGELNQDDWIITY